MSVTRDLGTLLTKIEAANNIYHNDEAIYQKQVSNLQTQNFLRRNKPKIILGSAVILELIALLGAAIAFYDLASLPRSRRHDADPYSSRIIQDIVIGGIACIVGIFGLALTIVTACRYRQMGNIPFFNYLNALPELPLPNPAQPKDKITDHFTSDQTEKIIRVCIHLADFINKKSTSDQKSKPANFNVFFPSSCSSHDPEETLTKRISSLKNKLTIQSAIEIIKHFQEAKISDNDTLKKQSLEQIEKAIIASCLSFCKYEESSPLIGLNG